ncbi:LOW QUALITY PROTEIN: hypothetical protein U9M48_027117 [Paspalum notatum var. saurae]|uniref:Reverse transcriptase domain-containing protein n=1 Tax=Paspalum notatum var. saurae TaxID=547442 RepID=A0AAQ3TWP6_PASNO
MGELEEAVKDMKSNTAPSPDGLAVTFFKKNWVLVKGPILEMLHKLYIGDLDLARLNYGIIILIPKIKGASQIRPICLLNVIYKIITKVLTMRLTKVASSVISETQTAFIPGRHILDGVVIVHEVVHQLKKTKKRGIILKLDFEKAYDKVNWTFLKEVLKQKNFDEKWIDWMLKAVTGGRVAINLNGEIGGYFRSYKEIFCKARRGWWIKGLVPELVEGGLTHLQYADDTILFLNDSLEEIRNVKFLLFCYEEMSGMKINYSKSEIFTVGLSEVIGREWLLGEFPMKYLSLPIGDKRLTKTEMNGPVEKVRKRLETWKCPHLSYGGKAVLINSCLTSIPMYMMGCYQLYEGAHQELDAIGGSGQQENISYGKMGTPGKTQKIWGTGVFRYKENEYHHACEMWMKLQGSPEDLQVDVARLKEGIRRWPIDDEKRYEDSEETLEWVLRKIMPDRLN